MSFKALLNRAVHHAPRHKWYDESAKKANDYRVKAALNNKRDGRALYTIG